MSMLKNLTSLWESAIVAVAGTIVNDEAASVAALGDNLSELLISGVDEITIRVKSLTLVAATSIDLYPQVADSAGEWAYVTYLGGAPVIINVDWDGVRESRALPAIAVRGHKFRILVGSTGTPGNEAIVVDAMRHRRDDT